MTILCRLEDVAEDDARGFEIDGHSLIVVRRDGAVYVYVNWCPHLGIELNFQEDEFFDLENHYLQCANHGALFEVDSGLCVLGPCKGNALRKAEFVIEGGAIRLLSMPQRLR